MYVKEFDQSRLDGNQKVHSSWQIFKIMAEFVDGLEALGKDRLAFPFLVPPGAREGNPYYELQQRSQNGLRKHGLIIFRRGPGTL